MPLTAEQTAALETLKGADAKEVADALKEAHADAYQHVFRVGYGTHKGEAKAKADALEAQIATLTQERDEAKAAAEAASGNDEQKAAERARLEKAAQDAKAEAKAAKEAARKQVEDAHRNIAKAALTARLVGEHRVVPEWAESVVVPGAAERIRTSYDEATGAVAVDYLDADQTPLTGGLDALAAQLAAGVKADYVRSTADGGSGAQNGPRGGPAGTVATQLAAKMKARYAPPAPTDTKSAPARAARYAPATQI